MHVVFDLKYEENIKAHLKEIGFYLFMVQMPGPALTSSTKCTTQQDYTARHGFDFETKR